MELFPCCICQKNSKCHIQSAFEQFVSENDDSIMTFRFKCEYFVQASESPQLKITLKQSAPCQQCVKNMDCHTKRQMSNVLSTFSGIVSDICFACKKKRTKHNPRMNLPENCLTGGPDFNCACCQTGYQCPQEGIRQIHTEPDKDTTVVKMEWIDPTGLKKITLATMNKSLFPYPWPELEQ